MFTYATCAFNLAWCYVHAHNAIWLVLKLLRRRLY